MAQKTDERTGSLRFSEHVVAGGPHDFMTVRHLRLRGSQRAIGRKLAEVVRSRYELIPIDHGVVRANRRLAFYQRYYPFHYQRTLGAADCFGMGSDRGEDTSLLPYNFPDFGCSVVFYPPDQTASGNATLSRNCDFPTLRWSELVGAPTTTKPRPTTADPYVVEVYPDQGYSSLYVSAYELLGGGLDGINSEGLTVALLATAGQEPARPTRSWQAGLSELEIVRYLLENCAKVDEARDALKSIEFYYFLVPCHYMIGDRYGNSFVWEYSLDRKRRHAIAGKGKVQWVTNHALHEYATTRDIPPSLTSSTFRRYKRLHQEINRSGKNRSVATIKKINLCVSANGASSGAVRTLWHALYDCHQRSLDIDFYLGESRPDKQKRSGYLHFRLEE